MPSFFGLFGGRNKDSSDDIVEGLNTVKQNESLNETMILEDKTFEKPDPEFSLGGEIQSVNESDTIGRSPDSVSKMLGDTNKGADQLLSGLSADLNIVQTYEENEEMSRDSVVGSAMEIITDDVCQRDEKTGRIVSIESSDAKLQKFLQDFLDNNVKIEDRIWTWTFEVVKHGDFKLRRREYLAGNSNIKSVYYEDVINPYLVSRIEYMGNIIGFEDEDYYEDGTSIDSNTYGTALNGYQNNLSSNELRKSAKFERNDAFVHFMNSKMSKRYRVNLNIRTNDNKMEKVTCYKVVGTSIVDNARYLFRIINMLDNMLILSRVARSTQYNLVKIEVGNASPGKTQSILMETRRRLEGSTKLRKNVGMQTDPSPIPINSNVYIPTRDGKGDVTVESIGDSVDVRSIVDIDYFKDKLFAALKIPKQYMGFDETMGALGNNSLVKMDIRYARSVQRVMNIMLNGIKELCNNYLIFRGRQEDVNNFKVHMRPLSTSEESNRVEEIMSDMQLVDSMGGFLQTYSQYIDTAKMFKTLLTMMDISPSDIGSEEFMQILKEMEEGTYKEENHQKPEEDSDMRGF